MSYQSIACERRMVFKFEERPIDVLQRSEDEHLATNYVVWKAPVIQRTTTFGARV